MTLASPRFRLGLFSYDHNLFILFFIFLVIFIPGLDHLSLIHHPLLLPLNHHLLDSISLLLRLDLPHLRLLKPLELLHLHYKLLNLTFKWCLILEIICHLIGTPQSHRVLEDSDADFG